MTRGRPTDMIMVTMRGLHYVVCILVLSVNIQWTQAAVDMTLIEKAIGASVVEAVIDKIRDACIFTNDRLFVRRLAFVETRDGKDPDTFSPGFYGGIWRITEDRFNATRACSGVLKTTCDMIKNTFSIDWTKTQWKDLLKPFYSGLATYMYLQLRNPKVPGDLTAQEKLWSHLFHQSVHNHTGKFATVVNTMSSGCEVKATDVVFLLDESGSVGNANFQKVKQFLVKTINSSNIQIGPDQFRVAVVKFSDSANVIFYLNAYGDKQSIIKQINAMGYSPSGTQTDIGINLVSQNVFSISHGAKPSKEAARLLVLVTDGQSNSRALTIAAADLARKNDIEIFAVGVGSNIDFVELEGVAKKCTRVFSLVSFDDFDNFIHELIKVTCKAKVHIEVPEGNSNTTEVVEKKVTIPKGSNKTTTQTKVDAGGNSTTIVVESNCAVVRIFGSYNNSNPGESLFEITGTAADGRPLVLFVKADKNGRPLFLTFEASKVNTSQKFCYNDSSFVIKINKGKPKVGEVICRENGVLRNCTVIDIIKSKWTNKLCPPTDMVVGGSNPCTADKLRRRLMIFPYPHDDTKYLQCDLKGRVYVVHCPPGLRYQPDSKSCGTEQVVNPGKKPLSGHPNPCTYDNIVRNLFFFPYPPDRHYFIHCDVWGFAWIVPCPYKTVWQQSIKRCVPEGMTTSSSLLNPCTAEARAKGEVFFPYPNDRSKYIHCDGNGNAWVQYCRPGMFFNTISKTCMSHNPVGGSSN